MSAPRYPHIFLKDNQESRSFTTPRKGREPEAPTADRVSHSIRLKKQWDAIWAKAKEQDESRTAVAQHVLGGTYVQFEGLPGFELRTISLEDRRQGIRLSNVYKVPAQSNPEIEITRATVFIPTGKENVFLKKLSSYANPEEDSTKTNNPRHHRLIQSIGNIRTALLESLWTDDSDLMPNDSTAVWCEIWLSSAEPEVEQRFRETATSIGIETKNRILRFPERSVLLGCATKNQLSLLLDNSPDIAEFRRAKETPRFFLELENKDQAEWVKDLSSRTEINDEQDISVCILDTGANNGHPLLEPLLSAEDCQSVDPSWGPADKDGHGTLMCGLSAYGDLTEALQSKEPVIIRHKLESVKILSMDKANDPDLYGELTIQGISRAEIQSPETKRVSCMAVTSRDNRDRGKPTSWSAAIDKVTSGYEDDTKRLVIVSGGNVEPREEWSNLEFPPGSGQAVKLRF